MQIYKGLDVGTAKVTEEEAQGIPHHLIDICNVDEKTFRRFFEEVRLDTGVQSGITTLAQNFELLRHKISYTKLFDEVGLVENEDYKRKVMGFDKFPTVLISPEAEDMLWDWLDGHH